MSYCGPWLDPTDVELCAEVANPLLPKAIASASELLYMLTGQQFAGRCTDTILPCSSGGACVQYLAYSHGGSRPIAGHGGMPSGPPFCGSHHQSVLLPGRPVIEVTEVLIDGVEFTDHALVDDMFLVRTDGNPWPCCQDFDDPTSWQVTYTYGSAPPALVLTAVEAMACELVKGWCPDGDCGECRLPKRLTQLTYEGASMTTLDPFDFLDNGRTGIYEVDTAINAYNPNGLQRTARARTARDYMRQPRRVR